MFEKSIDERLSIWFNFRKDLEEISDPLRSISYFWGDAPQIVHNTKLDPYNPKSWPTPWEIIVRNKYDDFTIAVMMGYTLRLTKRFSYDKIEVRLMVDNSRKQLYNMLCVNEQTILNYKKYEPVDIQELGQDFYLENIIELVFPR